MVCHLRGKLGTRLGYLNRLTINTSLSSQSLTDNTPSVNISHGSINMEDLMLLCNGTTSIYELPRPPISNGQIQPATPQLDEVGSQTSKVVDLDTEGYIHHFRDSSPQKGVSSQKIRSNTSVVCAPSHDMTNEPDLRRHAAVNGPSSDTFSSDGTFKDDWRNPAVTHPCLTKSSKNSLLDESFSNNADSTVDYAAMRSMVQAPPDPTIWGNKVVTSVYTRPMSGDTVDCKASLGLSITESYLPAPDRCTASGRSTPHSAHDIGDRNTPSRLDVTDARWTDPLTEIPSNGVTSDADGLATQAWANNHYGDVEDSDTSAISGHQGTADCHGILSIHDDNHASRVGLDSNRGAQYFNTSDDFDRHEQKATQKVGRPTGEPNIKQYSRFSNSQDTEQDSLLAVSSAFLFRVFMSMLT